MTDPLYNPEPFEQIPGQTCFDWNDAPDTRDTRPVRAITSDPVCSTYPPEGLPAGLILGRWDPFQ